MAAFRNIIFFFFCSFLSCQSETATIVEDIPVEKKPVVTKITDLHQLISETSGLIRVNGKLFTHNDSGGKAALYEIDQKTGDVVRTVLIRNTVNIDMEDVTQDDSFIYLGDIGNNSNTRRERIIYRISKNDFLTSDIVSAQKIIFSFSDHTDFTASDKKTNFDNEALIALGNRLFVFTKNWGDQKTSVYSMPKTPGTYKLDRMGSYNVNGLITGAVYNTASKEIILTGYRFFSPFIVVLTDFSDTNLLGGMVKRHKISLPGSVQVEGIAGNTDGTFTLSSEASGGLPASLYLLSFK